MLTTALLINRCCQISRAVGYTSQALDLLNSILADLCEHYDLALARGIFAFNFNPNLLTNFGSGPYPLPLDYLRTSGSSGSTGTQRSSWWTLDGVPRPMLPIDLSQFDMQVQQTGLASYPDKWATDMGGPLTDRIILTTTGITAAGSFNVTGLASVNGIAQGQGIAGEGIVPGTTVTAVVVNPGNGATTLTLSKAATATSSANGASLFFGIPPSGYAYPPPSGAFAVQIRYQRMLPPITDISKIPWFPNEGYLRKKLSAALMEFTSDTRRVEMEASANEDLRRYLDLKDDDTNRAQTVQLDRQKFGLTWSRLPNTKAIGWGS